MRSVRRVTTFVLLLIADSCPRSFRAAAAMATTAAEEAAPTTSSSRSRIATRRRTRPKACSASTSRRPDPAGFFDLLAQFIGGPAERDEEAYEVPPGLAMQARRISPPSDVTNIEIQSNGQDISGRFCWFVGADLGFVGAIGIQFKLTPVEVNGTNPLGPVARLPRLGLPRRRPDPASARKPERRRTRAAPGQCGRKRLGQEHRHRGRLRQQPARGFTVLQHRGPVHHRHRHLQLHEERTPLHDAQPAHRPCVLVLPRPNTEAVKVLDHGRRRLRRGSELRRQQHGRRLCLLAAAGFDRFDPGGNMNVARRGHTATWIPSNKVVIIGGETGGRPGRRSSARSRSSTRRRHLHAPHEPTADLPARRGHTATLLPSGKILIAGGFRSLRRRPRCKRRSSTPRR